MKKIILSLCTVFLAVSIYGQDVQPIYRSLEKSDFKKLMTHLDDPLELCINDEQDILEKNDAITAIRSFFRNAKPISITQIHKGSSQNNGSQYRVAKLTTEKGNYRLFFYIEKSGNSFVIKEMRIDPET